MDQRFSHNQYELRRKVLKLFGKTLEIKGPDGEELFYCDQKAFKLKEDIRVYSNKKKEQELLSLKARNIIDFSAAYDVNDSSEDRKIGVLRRKGMSSTFIRDSWTLADAQENQIAEIKEDSAALGFIRRHTSVGSLIPQNIDITAGGSVVARLEQKFNPFIYKSVLKINDPSFDQRLGIAVQMVFACIEERQH